MHTKAFPYISLLALFWGTNIVASRYGVGEFDPFFFIMLRLVIASISFAAVLLIAQRKLPQDPVLIRRAMLSGFLGVAIPMPTFILALQYMSSGVASIYVTSAPVMMVVAAHFFLPDEKLTRNKILGVVLALSGSIFLAIRGESGLAEIGRANPLGVIFILGGLVSETINTMYVRRKMSGMDPMQVTAIRLATAAVIVTIVTFILGDFSVAQVTATGIFSLAYAALIGALGGQFMAFTIQRRFGATAFSLTSYLIPLVATIFGVLLLGEIVTWGMGVGVLLIVGGLALINRQTAAEKVA